MFRFICLFCLFLLVSVVEGCYTTVVKVDSVPSGATVHWDYDPKGKTPTEFEEPWYGAHRLTLDHPDYGQKVQKVEMDPPAYLWFPFDFFVAILPFKVTDRQEYMIDLTQESPGSEEKIDESEGKKSS